MSARPGEAAWFRPALAGVAVVGLGGRLTYVAVVARKLPLVGDAETYHLLARVLADGQGYVRPRELALGLRLPTAEFPPMHPFVLALGDLVGLSSALSQRFLGACLGVVTVVLVGLLARRMGGPRAGILAAALAAVSPVLIEQDASLQAEGLYALLVTASLLAIHVAMNRRTSPAQLVLLGLLLGVTALTRSEAVLFVPVAGLLVAWRAGRPTLAGALRAVGLVAVGALALLGAWAVRSSVQLHAVVLTSTNAGTLVAGGNCDAVYHGPQEGLWRLDCVTAVDTAGLERDEAARTQRWIDAGARYAWDHAGEVPGVALVRVLRTWGVWDRSGQVVWESLEGRSRRWHALAGWFHLVMLPVAVAGLVIVGRRRRPDLVLLLTPIVASVVVSALSVGNTRFRAGADPVLLVAAAIAVDAVLYRWWPSRSRVSLEEPTAAARSPG